MGKYDEYFKPLIEQMNDPECSLHFFYWLVNLPLVTNGKEFHTRIEIPKTECKQKMMAMILSNIDLWFLNLYQTLKEIFDGKAEHNILDCNQNTIIDKSGNFLVACGIFIQCIKFGIRETILRTKWYLLGSLAQLWFQLLARVWLQELATP